MSPIFVFARTIELWLWLHRKWTLTTMTDFATLSGHRRQGLAGCLLKAMDAEMIQQGLKTAYSIARSLSAAMNITFAKNGYRYGGTLGNNTNIAGRIESMNIWYKHL
jgi:putative beta-lysine N-acetyltransferase